MTTCRIWIFNSLTLLFDVWYWPVIVVGDIEDMQQQKAIINMTILIIDVAIIIMTDGCMQKGWTKGSYLWGTQRAGPGTKSSPFQRMLRHTLPRREILKKKNLYNLSKYSLMTYIILFSFFCKGNTLMRRAGYY